MKKVWKQALAALCVLALMVGFVPSMATPAKAASTPTIWLVGDSTVCNYSSEARYVPRNGYGQALGNYVDSTKYTVKNIAASGRSSKDFISDSHSKADYATLTKDIKEGDYLIIGFGHNDEKCDKVADRTTRYTDPTIDGWEENEASFGYYLNKYYIKVAKDAKATPILCTPIVRRTTGSTYSGTNIHITAGTTAPTSDSDAGKVYPGGDYAATIKQVGADTNTPVIDLTTLTKDEWSAESADKNQYLHSWESATKVDNTHLNAHGAKMVAWLLTDAISKSDDTQLAALKAAIKTSDKPAVIESATDSLWTAMINTSVAGPTGYTPKPNGENKGSGNTFKDFTVGDATFYGTMFGSLGSTATSYYTVKAVDDTLQLAATENKAGKLSTTEDGLFMYYFPVPASATSYSLSATATVNNGPSDVQAGFGLMIRDDMYINEKLTDPKLNTCYVAAGTLGDWGTNCFGKPSAGGSMDTNTDLTGKGYAAGQEIPLSVSFDGDNYTAKFGDETAVGFDAGYSMKVKDDTYVYVGMFIARQADVTFSDIKLVVDGVTLCAPVDETGDKFAVTVQAGDHGTGTASPAQAVEGKTITLTATPDEGYILSGWEVVTPNTLTVTGGSFLMPAGAVTVKPTFVEDPDYVAAPTEYKAEITVDPAQAESDTNFHTVRRAVAYATKMPRTADQRVTVTIAPGIYQEQVVVDTPNLTFLNADPTQDVTITWYYGIGYKYYSASGGGVGSVYSPQNALLKSEKNEVGRWGSTLRLTSGSDGFLAENIIFENSFNYRITPEELADGVELANNKDSSSITFERKAGADVAAAKARERCAAIWNESNNSEFYRCTFLGSQDTMGTNGISYFKECVIEGVTDYICGQGSVVFDDCELRFKGYSDSDYTGAVITAPQTAKNNTNDLGYLFRNCTVTDAHATNSSIHAMSGVYGRPWSGELAKAIFYNTKLQSASIITSAGWTSMNSVDPANAQFYEYGTTTVDGTKVSNHSKSKSLTDAQAAALALAPLDYFGDWEPVHYVFGANVLAVKVTDPDGMDALRTNVGEAKTIQLSAKVKPSTATERGVTWTSTSTTVTVSDAGLVTIPANAQPETVTITATSNETGSEIKDEYTIVLLAAGVPLSEPKVHIFEDNAELKAILEATHIVSTGDGSSTGFVYAEGTGVTGTSAEGYTIKGVELLRCAKMTNTARKVTIKVPDTGKLTLYISNETDSTHPTAIADKLNISNGIGDVDIPAQLNQVVELDVAQDTYIITPVNVSADGKTEGLPFLYAIMWEPTASQGGDDPTQSAQPSAQPSASQSASTTTRPGGSVGGGGGTGSTSTPSPAPADTDTPVTADEVKVEKTETVVKADGTKVTTSELSNGTTAVKEVTPEGDVTVAVTNEAGEKVVDIAIPAEVPVVETKFEDVSETHWAAEAIDRVSALGLVKGVSETTYDTDSTVTRGTLATMLFRLANGAEGKTSTFADVPKGEWYADAIGWATEAGVVTGYSETEFGPNDQLTREQMAVMLLRFAKLIGMDSSVEAEAVAKYADANEVSAWAADGMAWCVKNGIINGTSETTLTPEGSASRAQTAVMLDRFIALLK